MKDPRLRLSAVIIAVQVLGQTVLGFKLSIAQVLAAVLTSVVLEAGVMVLRGEVLRWPASAMLTGNGVALLLRTVGTRHGDWWSLNGVQFFILAAALAIASKQLLRPTGRHLYNPSNLGLVLVFLLAGPANVYPQYLWWGPFAPPVIAAWVVIGAGAVWVLRPLRMASMVIAFAVPFTLLVAVLASAGACFEAAWRVDSVCGLNYWIAIATSPEVAIFVLFMMSDPRTAPVARRARVLYGAATALLAAALLSLQPTEFGVKVSILAALTVACTLVPLIDLVAGHRSPGGTGLLRATGGRLSAWPRRPAVSAVVAVVLTTAVSGAVVAMGGNPNLVTFERGGVTSSGGAPKQ